MLPATSRVKDYFQALQDRIVAALERLDGGRFWRDAWTRAEGGGGDTRVIENGDLFERGGVAFSHVQGSRLPPSASASRPELAGRAFEAMGVSLVLHPRNPHCPTVHMNVRFFCSYPGLREDSSGEPPRGADDPGARHTETDGRDAGDEGKASGRPGWWFGGGMDLTPYYGFEEDCVHFHRVCREALAPFGPQWHPRFKRWCDEYFLLKHRGEPRGIGGIFFDDLNEPGFEQSFALVRSVGDHFLPAYAPIIERRRAAPYGERERDFQAYRRGRYVEFNLVWDRGTLFGLQSGGRTESILMSLPPLVKWRYEWRPEPGSAEDRLYRDFLKPRDWAGESAA